MRAPLKTALASWAPSINIIIIIIIIIIPDNKGGDTHRKITVNSLGESNLVVVQALFDF